MQRNLNFGIYFGWCGCGKCNPEEKIKITVQLNDKLNYKKEYLYKELKKVPFYFCRTKVNEIAARFHLPSSLASSLSFSLPSFTHCPPLIARIKTVELFENIVSNLASPSTKNQTNIPNNKKQTNKQCASPKLQFATQPPEFRTCIIDLSKQPTKPNQNQKPSLYLYIHLFPPVFSSATPVFSKLDAYRHRTSLS